jgi:hypothetical protein
VCQDCPTTRDRVRGVAREVAADLMLPVVLAGIVLALVLASGGLSWGDLFSRS